MTPPILVVEDNLDNLKLTGWILEDAGYAFDSVVTGEEALDYLDHTVPTLILLDISLPGIQGTEVAKRVRGNPKTTKIPMIAVTAHAIKGEDSKIMASGVDAIVTKPIDEDTLVRTMRLLLCPASDSPQKGAEP